MLWNLRVLELKNLDRKTFPNVNIFYLSAWGKKKRRGAALPVGVGSLFSTLGSLRAQVMALSLSVGVYLSALHSGQSESLTPSALAPVF